MPNYLPSITLFTALALPASLAAAAPPTRELSKADKLELLGLMLESFDLKPTPGAVMDVPETDPIPRSVSAAAIKAGLALFANGFSFEARAGQSELTIDNRPALVPATSLVQGELGWNKAFTSASQSVPLPPDPRRRMTPFERLAQTQVTAPGAKPIQRLEGTLTVRYPTRVDTATFATNEIGKAKTLAGASCQLVALENDLATLACTGKVDDLELHPLSTRGIALATKGTMQGPTRIHQAIAKGGMVTPAQKETLLAAFDTLKTEGRTFLVRAAGKVAGILAVQPADFQTTTLTVQAFPAPDFDGKQCPANVPPRYLPATPAPRFATMGEAAIRQGTSIRPGRSEAVYGFNDQEIFFTLPDVPNSRFATLEVKDLILRKKGAIVPYEPQGPFQDSKVGFLYTLRMERTGGEGPIDFDAGKGRLAFRYPTRVATRRVTSPGRPGQVLIQGCEVTVFTDGGLLKPNDTHATVRAFDRAGHPLAPADRGNTSGQNRDGEYRKFRFWGQVAAVELDEAKEWKELVRPFFLKPLPPRPKRP